MEKNPFYPLFFEFLRLISFNNVSKLIATVSVCVLFISFNNVYAGNNGFSLNDRGYFENQENSVFIFHNIYPEGKQGGIEIIQHGERVATNGDLRLNPSPGQWDPLPVNKDKKGVRILDKTNGVASVPMNYPAVGIDYTIQVRGAGNSFRVSVDLDKPLPAEMAGKVRMNLELYPSVYFGKTYYLGNSYGVFPRQSNNIMVPGPDGIIKRPFGTGYVLGNSSADYIIRNMVLPDRGLIQVPLAKGKKLSIASEDPLRAMTIEQVNGELELYDGRDINQQGWFNVSAVLPAGETKNAVEWIITPNLEPSWIRPPVISNSQAGYRPNQEKRIIIELDPRSMPLRKAVLERIDPVKGVQVEYSGLPKTWGKFLRYEYAVFDITKINKPGMYQVRYGKTVTPPFPIGDDIYRSNVWEPTLETFFPVQMCHMEVRDRFRVWHGACHLDDALQAPAPFHHFDGYKQGPATETQFKPGEHVPYLNEGGWHDAGDLDVPNGSVANATFMLALAREEFSSDIDQTSVDYKNRQVELHVPDGIPDIVQQVEHGVLNLLSGYRAAGHSFTGIIESKLQTYAQFGDASVGSDNLIYDPSLAQNVTSDGKSGRDDDRWVFTSRNTSLEYKVATALTASSRVLKGYRDDLSKECLATAEKVWDFEQTHEPSNQPGSYVPGNPRAQEIFLTSELLITTGNEKYRKHLIELWSNIEKSAGYTIWSVVRAMPFIHDDIFQQKIEELLKKCSKDISADYVKNPYGVPYHYEIWGIGWTIQETAFRNYFLVKSFPNLFNKEIVINQLNWVLGCHPASDTSHISGVGAKSATAAYGVTRGDWSYIPGGVVSGVGLIMPDFPELKEPFPFLWQQMEYVLSGAASYIFCVQAADKLLNN